MTLNLDSIMKIMPAGFRLELTHRPAANFDTEWTCHLGEDVSGDNDDVASIVYNASGTGQYPDEAIQNAYLDYIGDLVSFKTGFDEKAQRDMERIRQDNDNLKKQVKKLEDQAAKMNHTFYNERATLRNQIAKLEVEKADLATQVVKLGNKVEKAKPKAKVKAKPVADKPVAKKRGRPALKHKTVKQPIAQRTRKSKKWPS